MSKIDREVRKRNERSNHARSPVADPDHLSRRYAAVDSAATVVGADRGRGGLRCRVPHKGQAMSKILAVLALLAMLALSGCTIVVTRPGRIDLLRERQKELAQIADSIDAQFTSDRLSVHDYLLMKMMLENAGYFRR